VSANNTPGPWTFGQVGKGQVFDIIGPDVTGLGREVVGSFRASQNTKANAANAQLIAAAPELLAALKEALGILAEVGAKHAEYHGTAQGPSSVGAAYIRVKSAIAKAEAAK